MHVTQCNIAHALEKTKYLYSDLYWKDNDAQYHFATQFTADLIAMNSADFIITSTYQRSPAPTTRSASTRATCTSPCRICIGSCTASTYSIQSSTSFHPAQTTACTFRIRTRNTASADLHGEIEDMIFGGPREDARGVLSDPGRPVIFTMARLDRIKNITGLVSWYAEHPDLRNRANLVVVAGAVDPHHSDDREEQAQIERMHGLFDEHGLDGCVRWLGVRLDKTVSGEIYRCIADHRGSLCSRPFSRPSA
jgi:sucrose synthase